MTARSLGTLFYLGSRIDALAALMDARFDGLVNVMESWFSRVDTRFDTLEGDLRSHLDRHAA